MRLFAENPNRLIDDFSHDFECGFMETLSHRHGTKRVQANRVYQEYIADKSHIHMNATIWTSLTELCKHLGREGKAIVDETEKGWFIQYIDRDPRLLAKQAAADQRKVVELDEEERTRRVIEAQIAAATVAVNAATTENASFNSTGEDDTDDGKVDLMRLEGAIKIEVSFAAKKRPLKMASASSSAAIFSDTANSLNATSDSSIPSSSAREHGEPPAKRIYSSSSSVSQQPMTAMEQLVREDQGRKLQLAKQQMQREPILHDEGSDGMPPDIRKENWLATGITVKCMSKTLSSGKYYKKKGTVTSVHDQYLAEVTIDDAGDGSCARIRIDQNELETVIPKVGRPCLILNGRGRGSRATLIRINEEQYSCDVQLHNGQELSGIDYEDISKIGGE